MLTEEAHHMQVGETGITRMIQRTLEVMNELKTDSIDAIRNAGAIDLQTIQRYINFWFSSSLDLFGSEISSNSATAFANGLKGRPDEMRYEDHSEKSSTFTFDGLSLENTIETQTIPMRNAMNEITRRAYVTDCEVGLKRWNRLIKKSGYHIELKLPSTRFRRNIGIWAGVDVNPEGQLITKNEYDKSLGSWLPSENDKEFINSLMVQVTEINKTAGWIASPNRGINNMDIGYEYVNLKK
jgi:benzoyl-CoA 2,3-dioxygenase component B